MRLAFLSLLCGLCLCNAQQDTNNQQKNLWQDFTYDMGSVFGGIGYSYSRPLYWKGEQWSHFGAIAGGTTALYFVDDEFNSWVGGWREDVPDWLITYGNEYGSAEYNYMLTGAVYLSGLFTRNEKLRRTGVLLISSATAGGFFQQVTKRMVGRARPRSGDSSDVFDPFHLDRVRFYDSFPSGHAMLAFTNAYAIAKQFKNPWVKGGIYAVGAIPGFIRVIDEFHWISDVAFSMAMGVFIVEAIDRFLDRKYNQKYNDSSKDLSWDLTFSPGRLGVSVRF